MTSEVSAALTDRMERSIVYIVGFMAVGKSSVGNRLACRLGWQFVDLDSRIELRAGETIRELFAREGEAYFRRLEAEELRRVSTEKQTIVALGGGAFCDPENQKICLTTGRTVWLDAPLEVLYPRCAGDGSRPLFGSREEMMDLLERRRPYYQKADLRLDVTGCNVDQLAEMILKSLGRT